MKETVDKAVVAISRELKNAKAPKAIQRTFSKCVELAQAEKYSEAVKVLQQTAQLIDKSDFEDAISSWYLIALYTFLLGAEATQKKGNGNE